MISPILLNSIEPFQRLQMFTQLKWQQRGEVQPCNLLTNVYRLQAICHLLTLALNTVSIIWNRYWWDSAQAPHFTPRLRDDKKGVRGASPHTDPRMDRLNVPQIKFVCPTNNPRRLVFISLTNSSLPGLYCHGDEVPMWLFGHTYKKHFTLFPMVGSWAEQYILSTSTSQCAHVQY